MTTCQSRTRKIVGRRLLISSAREARPRHGGEALIVHRRLPTPLLHTIRYTLCCTVPHIALERHCFFRTDADLMAMHMHGSAADAGGSPPSYKCIVVRMDGLGDGKAEVGCALVCAKPVEGRAPLLGLQRCQRHRDEAPHTKVGHLNNHSGPEAAQRSCSGNPSQLGACARSHRKTAARNATVISKCQAIPQTCTLHVLQA